MKIGYGCLVNDFKVLGNTLLRSPIGGELRIAVDAKSASEGLNKLIKDSDADVLVLIHQDVFLPDGWEDRLISIIEKLDDDWGLLGVWGARIENGGFQSIGNIADTRLNNPHVWYGELPTDNVETLDEMCLVINMKSGFLFDEKMIGWDLYGAYACLKMKEIGRKVFVVDNLAIHNTRRSLDWKPNMVYLSIFEWLKSRFPDNIVLSTVYHKNKEERINPVFYGN
mgnify:CR=1 FL=1